MKRRPPKTTINAELGYAADDRGRGIVYAQLGILGKAHLMRIAFRLRSSYGEREVAYAALTAIARTLHRRGIGMVRFVIEDEQLISEVTVAATELPAAMVLPYVRLKCALNQFASWALVSAPQADLTQRARAEIALNSVA